MLESSDGISSQSWDTPGQSSQPGYRLPGGTRRYRRRAPDGTVTVTGPGPARTRCTVPSYRTAGRSDLLGTHSDRPRLPWPLRRDRHVTDRDPGRSAGRPSYRVRLPAAAGPAVRPYGTDRTLDGDPPGRGLRLLGARRRGGSGPQCVPRCRRRAPGGQPFWSCQLAACHGRVEVQTVCGRRRPPRCPGQFFSRCRPASVGVLDPVLCDSDSLTASSDRAVRRHSDRVPWSEPHGESAGRSDRTGYGPIPAILTVHIGPRTNRAGNSGTIGEVLDVLKLFSPIGSDPIAGIPAAGATVRGVTSAQSRRRRPPTVSEAPRGSE
eukprot:762458-Hanusia_phi.AAC.1